MRTKSVAPAYPAEAKQNRVQGSVVLETIIGKAGNVESVTVLSGPEELRESAITAVSQWEYQPTLLNGEPVTVITNVTVNYILQ